MGTQTISRSTKQRQGARYIRGDKELDRSPRMWMQIVEKDEIGKNKKGKKIYSSRTRHIPA